MAAGHSDYTRGDMPVDAHRGTFTGFMAGTKYGSALLVVVLLFPTLFFGTALGWFSSLVISTVIGIIIGMALKLNGAWYASIIAMAIVTAGLWVIISAFV